MHSLGGCESELPMPALCESYYASCPCWNCPTIKGSKTKASKWNFGPNLNSGSLNDRGLVQWVSAAKDQVLELLGCFFPAGLTWLVAYSGSPVSHLSSSCTCTSGCLLEQLPWAGHWGAPLTAADSPVARWFVQGDRAMDPSWEQLRPQISYSSLLNAKFTGLSPVKIAHSSESWIVLGSTGKHMLAQKYLAFKVFLLAVLQVPAQHADISNCRHTKIACETNFDTQAAALSTLDYIFRFIEMYICMENLNNLNKRLQWVTVKKEQLTNCKLCVRNLVTYLSDVSSSHICSVCSIQTMAPGAPSPAFWHGASGKEGKKQQTGKSHLDWHCSKEAQQYITETEDSLGQHMSNTVLEMFTLVLSDFSWCGEFAFIFMKSD